MLVLRLLEGCNSMMVCVRAGVASNRGEAAAEDAAEENDECVFEGHAMPLMRRSPAGVAAGAAIVTFDGCFNRSSSFIICACESLAPAAPKEADVVDDVLAEEEELSSAGSVSTPLQHRDSSSERKISRQNQR
jgi:hypothetical protein